VGLNVGVFGAEQLSGPVDGEPFDHVDVFAPAVVARARYPSAYFVSEDASLGFEDGLRNVVLWRRSSPGWSPGGRAARDGRRHVGIRRFEGVGFPHRPW